MSDEKVNQLIESLENQELQSPNGVLSAANYAELFAAYLYKGELCSARYLWKRIPDALKPSPTNTDNTAADLDHLWSVYQTLWLNEVSAFFTTVQSVVWHSVTVGELIAALRTNQLDNAIRLISEAYTSIYEDRLVQMVQLDAAAVEERCRSLGWEFEEGDKPRLVRPKRCADAAAPAIDAEEQLAKLTDFVSFLEN